MLSETRHPYGVTKHASSAREQGFGWQGLEGFFTSLRFVQNDSLGLSC